ncbi:MAG: deoxyribose-phosphate aldolase [Bifidobacteriaceae bacterium]|nr:deoxyribose-phosphate aldolase [Bifidobacteriaceae bacterium]
MNRRDVSQLIDHTLLKPEATAHDVGRLIAEGRALGVFSVCVSPSMLPLDAQGLAVVTVAGFPTGAHRPEVVAAEAARAVADGADEVDLVLDLGAAKASEWAKATAGIAAVRAAVPRPKLLKVIIESAALTDAQIVAACWAAQDADADFVKTSTGFHPAGGASVHAVDLMARTVGGRLGVKASGGIRTTAEAIALIEAGATRLGLSQSAAVLSGLPE